jgi:L-amino acid N-acyltransferase YncA
MTLEALLIRDATAADAPVLLEIYRPFVESSTVSFETEMPSVDEFSSRMRKALGGWAWLVAEIDGRRVGYAYGSALRERAAYRWSVETSAYVDAEHRRRGIGRRLYVELLARLAERGYCNAFACITLPNDASVALHREVGFSSIGVFPRAGWKFGAWRDVAWLARRLRDLPPNVDPGQ